MKKALGLITASFAVLVIASAGAWAQSSKATAKCADLSVITEEAVSTTASEGPAWQTILSNQIRTAEPSDLFVDVSLECGLNTLTVVRSKAGARDTATATAAVKVRVLIDGVEAYPGPVTFCQRKQELSAVFGGIFNATVDCVDPLTGAINAQCLADNCLVVNDAGAIVIDETCLLPEELSLLLETVNANAFNFLLADIGVGIHTVEVQAALSASGTAGNGEVDYGAFIGKGSVTVDEVKLIKGEDILP